MGRWSEGLRVGKARGFAERENWYGEVQLRGRIVRLRVGLKKGDGRKGLQRMRGSHGWDR